MDRNTDISMDDLLYPRRFFERYKFTSGEPPSDTLREHH